MVKRLFALVALLLLASPASAWWEYGHYSVGRVAMLEVKPSTRAAVLRLLAQSKLLETPECPVRTIEEASYWPDCVKTLGERFSYAYSWHYQNVDICKPFDLKSACKDGHCVSAQIERNAKLLADPKVPARERLMALAFLVHFMGDLHQPLHAGDKSDRGGNDFKADYGAIPSNIHAIWDGLLADRSISSPPSDAAGILSALMPEEKAQMRLGSVQDWSQESWATAREFGYGALMADPCGPLPTSRPKMDEATVQRLIPILRRQVARGGIRLARLLDEALG
ncbi:MAG: nuclease [Sphingomonadales bacterium]|nr:nuclease [Sphingomonadales bacterium]